MDRALWIAANGMEGQTRMTENIANNLSNVNTTSYKRGQVHFQDLFYQTLTSVGAATEGGIAPVGIQVGTGSRVSGIARNFSQGSLNNTGGQLNLSIAGDGFFEVEMPDGTSTYTRDGNFHRNAEGIVVTEQGYVVKNFPAIDAKSTQIDISETGIVSVTVNGDIVEAGEITIARFPNKEGLKALGGNLYKDTPASGPATIGTPGDNGAGMIRQGFLEDSNVEVVQEMVDMIASQRAYEIISKSIKTSDEMLRTATNLK